MSQPEPESFDPKRRRLCPDGACVGLIGGDGRCRVCGAADAGGAGVAMFSVPADEPEPDDVPQLAAGNDLADDLGSDAGGGFDSSRRLCPDGDCLGVMGPDGRCKVCGRRAEG